MAPFVSLALFLSTAAPEPAEAPPFPWKLERTHKYVWLDGKEKVGETIFRFEELGGDETPTYRVSFHRQLARGGNTFRVEANLTFRRDGRPLVYHENCRLDSLVAKSGSHQEVRISFSREQVETVTVHNGKSDQAVRRELPVPEDAYLFFTHALEHWSVLVLGLGDDDNQTLNVFYPQFATVMKVEFRREAQTRKLPVGDREVECAVWRFRCADPKFSGSVWIDGAGRLLSYRQGSLELRLTAK